MKLFDFGTTALVVFAAFYFADWVGGQFNPPPRQCLYSYQNVQTWAECGLTEDEQKLLFKVK